MYKAFNGKKWLNFETYEELVNWLSQFNVYCGKRVEENSFLSKVGNSDKDTFRHVERKRTGKVFRFNDGMTIPEYITTITYDVRSYRVFDSDDKSIYDKNLIKDVFNHKFDGRYYTGNNKKPRYYWRWWNLPESAYPEFRRGPIPYIHVSHTRYGCRYIRTTNERRQTCNKESEPFNRASRAYNLPNVYDDIIRDWRDSGWKSQGKHRHQWENGVNQKVKHTVGKHTYVCKAKNKRHIDSDWIDMVDDADFGSDLD